MIFAPFHLYIISATKFCKRLPPKYNLDTIKSISTIAKDSLEEYKKNSTNLVNKGLNKQI